MGFWVVEDASFNRLDSHACAHHGCICIVLFCCCFLASGLVSLFCSSSYREGGQDIGELFLFPYLCFSPLLEIDVCDGR